jgi:DNA polymerase-1
MILLIDADILLYKFAFRNEEHYEWNGGVTSTLVDAGQAYMDADAFIDSLMDDLKAEGHFLCFSHPQNFRYTVLPTYKHNRVNLEKPQLYDALKDYLLSSHPYKMKQMLEADDVMGILGSMHPKKYCVCSLDKDLMCIPGTHFNWNKMKKPTIVTEAYADYFFAYQTLIGDSTDGYTGCPKIGPKKAEKLLAPIFEDIVGDHPDYGVKCRVKDLRKLNKAMWEAVIQTYKGRGFDMDFLLQQARVARILRHTDYNIQTKEIKLWHPPTT